MLFKSVRPSALFERENRRYVEYLTTNAFATSSMLIKSMYKSELESYFFASEYGSDEIVGCINADYSSLNHIRIIIHGPTSIYNSFCKASLSQGEKYIFEYIREDERDFFFNTFRLDPDPQYGFYLFDKKDLSIDTSVFADQTGEGITVREFSTIPVETIIEFYNFSISEKTIDLFTGYMGLALFKGEKMIAGMYDNFSKLPVVLNEAMIAGVMVQKEFRNQGMCTRLLSLIVQKLHEKGKGPIGLYVNYNNKKAIKCYENSGFVKKANVYRCVIPVLE